MGKRQSTRQGALAAGGLALAVFLTLGFLPAACAGQKQEAMTLTVFFSDPNASWNDMQDDIGKYITEKTGVTLKAEFAVGDPIEKINLIAASGQYPDLILPKGESGTLVDAGAMIDLEPLIDQHAPNIKKIMGAQMSRMRFSLADPKIYLIPTVDVVDQINFDTDAFFKLQLDALKEQHYPRVETLADYEKVIADYVKAHPTTADGKPTIGLSLLADSWRIVISTTNPAFWATGASDDGEWYIDPATYDATPHYFRPEERDYFRWLNHMNDVGLLDKESFIQKYDQYIAKIASGRVVGLIDADWEIQDAVNSLKKENKFGKIYGRFGAVLKPGIKAAYNTPTGFRGGWGVGITTACKDPVRAVKFLDYLASEEGQILITWGIEGKHYKVENGKRVLLPEYEKMRVNDPNTFRKSVGSGNYLVSLRYGDGVKDATGNYFTFRNPQQILDVYTPDEKAALKAYGVTFWNDLLPKPEEFTPKPWAAAWSIATPADSDLNNFWNVEQAIVGKYIPKAIRGATAEFDATYDAFLKELEKQCDKFARLETALVKDRLKLWGYLK